MTEEQKQSVMAHMKHWTKDAPSESGLRVALMLHEWEGLHHMDAAQMKKVEWSNPRFQIVKLSKYMACGQLSTFDFSALTRLVFLAHDHCIRVQLSPCNPQFMDLVFHPRNVREGGMSERHPTLETAVQKWREANKAVELPELAPEPEEATP